jgi:hypothetical protein
MSGSSSVRTCIAEPYSCADRPSVLRKALIAGRFPICRGIWPGLNRGRMDFAQLKAVALGRDQVADIDIDAWLDRATAAKAWLIFFTHDVSDDPSRCGCPTKRFASIVEAVARRGIKVLPVKNAAGFALHAPKRRQRLTGHRRRCGFRRDGPSL